MCVVKLSAVLKLALLLLQTNSCVGVEVVKQLKLKS
jgi:hypothetical protein